MVGEGSCGETGPKFQEEAASLEEMLALQPDVELTDDDGEDNPEDEPQDFPAVDADLDKQVEAIRALHSEVQHEEGAPPTSWRIDKFGR